MARLKSWTPTSALVIRIFSLRTTTVSQSLRGPTSTVESCLLSISFITSFDSIHSPTIQDYPAPANILDYEQLKELLDVLNNVGASA
ncbi:hypothetical protein F441_13776 [Phytophthora nicotianae CJ01A1]|uniref:Uncharacterized protein n=5 Tax=Phytophthora nicotianae TaxID=4792 RepID=W2PXF4_PHYN3|nr:hypothetical protein PPTG_23493 [Phytophthora nicotianae INRA-310]ETK80963.1 hypothetical protein L915_13491 [Phytophthora nicotianae]ETO69553.1 hypothetical protein F444_13886 [Phytophthora nicotianae P1976]ETP10603.1 hypothetical protein F441_13776 [Phytophthora nicotianae CJ01A1]ETP38800.1 hypothetical protein F442_13683 [Phytophthora nicotianae P10297]ETL34382.1 hypothetical protein L916_13387 [Phytophthora nicotianae]